MSSRAQKGVPRAFDQYAEWNTIAGKAYEKKDYQAAAKAYEKAALIDLGKAFTHPPDDFYNAGFAYALAGNPAKAFAYLFKAANAGFYQLDHLLEDTDLNTLHAMPQWKRLVNQVTANSIKENERLKRIQLVTPIKETVFYPLTAYASQFLNNTNKPLLSINHSSFRLHMRANSYTTTHLPEVVKALNEATDRIRSVLKIEAFPRGINLLFTDSAGEMKDLTGFAVHSGMANPGHDLCFFVVNASRRPAFKHELMHQIVADVWGNTVSRLLNEGFAVYSDNECGFDNPIKGFNAWLFSSHKQVSITSLLEQFDALARKDEVATYFQSAGIVMYLIEKYGIERFHELWIKGFDAIQEIYGVTLSELESAITNQYSNEKAPQNVDWKKILANGCG